MRKLSTFNFITLNGFFKGADGDISWHPHDQEGGELASKSLKAENILVFGRTTYEMMEHAWTSDAMKKQMPEVAARMNSSEKIVVSSSMKEASWGKTQIIATDLAEEMKKIKSTAGKDVTILGSGSIVEQLADAGLVDEFQILLDPVAIGEGSPIFAGLQKNLNLKLVSSTPFKSGAILLVYHPA